MTRKQLSQAELEKVALGDGDSKRFNVTGPRELPEGAMAVGKGACGSVGGVLAGRTEPRAASQLTSAGVDLRMPATSRIGLLRLLVQAHTYTDARATLSKFRSDVAECSDYKDMAGRSNKVSLDAAPKRLGEEAVAYRIRSAADEVHRRAQDVVVGVVRSGSVVVIAYGESVDDQAKSVRDVRNSLNSLLRAQVDRLPHAP
ncbi:hypothetical protein ABT127_28570 [Streptomyces sp. NPDC001904]|uniref:hypothetical protein n=1 Tax=Streptomyces sp. NPDC001904 TaxID=3154531 RepID=UPI003326E0F5